MSPRLVSSFVALAALLCSTSAQITSSPAGPAPALATYPATALAKKGPFQYPDGIPYQVDTDTNLIRGVQKGYNICNSTTEGPKSLCQTGWLNSLDDFCLWAPAESGHMVGDIEGEMIAWCTKPGHGSRLIPEGALTGVQFMKTPDYVQVVGFIDQTQINMVAGDYGGEMDPHGADARGNPMGGIMFSNQFTGSPIQAIEWHNFIGSDSFCFKACDPNGPNAADYCEHIFDRIGCAYNAPNNARNGTFETCEGENQDFPGRYVGPDGATTTYTQPPESFGIITTMPYTARVPASSNCQVFESRSIYTGLPTPSVGPTTKPSSSSTPTGKVSNTPHPGPSSSSSSANASPSSESGAETLAISGIAVMGVVFSALFLS